MIIMMVYFKDIIFMSMVGLLLLSYIWKKKSKKRYYDNYAVKAVEKLGIVAHELTLEGELGDVRPVVVRATLHLLEASPGDVGEPLCRIFLALQLVALAISDRVALPFEELPQRLEV